MTTIVCSKCKIEKDDCCFNRSSASKTGFRPDCKECRRPIRLKYLNENSEELKNKNATWQRNNPESAKLAHQRYRENHPEEIKERVRNWQQNNKEADAIRSAKQRSEKKQATPAWADIKKIKSIYAEARKQTEITGIQMHVDHDIPLKGLNVSGLHVDTNLRIMEAIPNMRKKNKFTT